MNSYELLHPNTSWASLQAFDWVRALGACPQDPIHHAEGNVWIHTRMVREVLRTMPEWQALPPEDQQIVDIACLMHDIAKPYTTEIEEGGRVTAKGHSRAGELLARRILWEMGAPFSIREQVCGLIRYHQIPFYLIDRDDAQRLAAEISITTRCDLLALVAEADIRGRICADMGRVVENIELFREFCRDVACYISPKHFASDHTRFVYFHSMGRDSEYIVHNTTKLEVVVMSGLPGSGKDTYIKEHFSSLPVVSLDDIREEYDVDPTKKNQGEVVQIAKERAREFLRKGDRFVWNATNLNRQRRDPIISLLSDYGARAHIVYVEVPRATLITQNKARKASVPEHVIHKMTSRWEIPTLKEAHRVTLEVRQ